MQYSQVKEMAYHFCQIFNEQREETRRRLSDSLKVFASNMTTEEKMEAYHLAIKNCDKKMASRMDIEVNEDKYNWKSTL